MSKGERLPIPRGATTWSASVEVSVVRFYDADGQLISLCKHGRSMCPRCGGRRVPSPRALVRVMERAVGRS